jgi:hypothetical protein
VPIEIVVSCPSISLLFTSAYFLEVEATIGFKKLIAKTPIKSERITGVISIDIDDFPAALKTISSEFRAKDRKVHAELKIMINGKT